MASGQLLSKWLPKDNEFTGANFCTEDTRNGHPVLDFDATTQEIAVFSDVMHPEYDGGNIVVNVLVSLTSATTGTVGFDFTVERIGAAVLDIDADGWATAKTITAATVPGTSGHLLLMQVTLTAGATDTDSVVASELYRGRLRRDVANDTATGDAEIHAVWLVEA